MGLFLSVHSLVIVSAKKHVICHQFWNFVWKSVELAFWGIQIFFTQLV